MFVEIHPNINSEKRVISGMANFLYIYNVYQPFDERKLAAETNFMYYFVAHFEIIRKTGMPFFPRSSRANKKAG